MATHLRSGCAAALLCVLLTTGAWPSQPARAGSAAAAPADTQRIERLAALGKLWGTIKFFHPYLAYQEIDWDRALIDAIPKVRAARTPEEYRRAVDQMLAALGDPATHASLAPPATMPAAPSVAAAEPAYKSRPPTYWQTVEGALVVRAPSLIAAMLAARQEGHPETFTKLWEQVRAAIEPAKGVVIDARTDEGADASNFFFAIFRDILSSLIDRSVLLGTRRFRMHSGYAPQRGQSSGDYYSALVTTTPEPLLGQRPRGAGKPLVILISDRTPDMSDLLTGLQAAGLARVFEEGDTPTAGFGVSTFQQNLPDGVVVTIRNAELVAPNGSVGFRPDERLPKAANTDAALTAAVKAVTRPTAPEGPAGSPAAAPPSLRTKYDAPYTAMTFPDAEYRLLGLFRFWNIIRFFYPYQHLIGEPWDDVLVRFIPRFEANRDARDYQKSVLELVAAIHDSHVTVSDSDGFVYLGNYCPPVIARPVEGKTLIVALPDPQAADTAGLHEGDEIVTIDGEPTSRRIEHLEPLISASTPQRLQRDVHHWLLAGPEKSRVKLGVRSGAGAVREIDLERTQRLVSLRFPPRSTPVYGVLPNGYGYIDLDRLPRQEADQAMDAVMTTPGLIFDMRGYPHGTAWVIALRRAAKKVAAARFERPQWASTDLSDSSELEGFRLTFTQTVAPNRSKLRYTGRVVMLINAEAMSQAEHTCLFFEAATEVTFIGSATAGVNGDVTNCVLPGGIAVTFTGHDVRHGDGRQLQRVGIQPDILVEPTADGIRHGRDEVLAAAYRFLQNHEPRERRGRTVGRRSN